jgi:hypothetical protein
MCGPDMNQEVLAYIKEGASDQGLTNILQQFKTLYPYLSAIAHANHIKDPFDHQVVEAYWLGNPLLDNISPQDLYKHTTDTLKLPKKINPRSFDLIKTKIASGGLMHHSFHVLNLWDHKKFFSKDNNLQELDSCRISAGRVIHVDGAFITLKRKPLTINKQRQLALGSPLSVKILRRLETSSLLDNIQVGDIISMHWESPCEVITEQQYQNLNHYTSLSIKLANLSPAYA